MLDSCFFSRFFGNDTKWLEMHKEKIALAVLNSKEAIKKYVLTDVQACLLLKQNYVFLAYRMNRSQPP